MKNNIPPDLRPSLQFLAEAIFPIGEWVENKAPPDAASLIPSKPPLPWRNAGTPKLNTATMEVLQAFEMAFDEDEENAKIASRWALIEEKPLMFFIPSSGTAEEWRKERGLLDPQFAVHIEKSNNVRYIIDVHDDNVGNTKAIAKKAVSRSTFYNHCWTSLRETFDEKTEQETWWNVVEKLNDEKSNAWPVKSAVTARSFLRHFSIDILIACLGQKNPALEGKHPIWQRAVLIEANENRHVGNEYTPREVDRAVQRMLDTLKSISII